MTNQAKRSGGGSRVAVFTLALVGAGFMTVGCFFIMAQNGFTARSDAAQVTVTFVDRRLDDDDRALYRPTFEARASDGNIIEYSGGGWVAPKPHNEGDVVDGRVDWVAGEIRSAKMMKTASRLGIIFAILGGIMLMASLIVAGRMVKSRR